MQRAHPVPAPDRFLPDDIRTLALFASLGGERQEACAFAYLDPEWRLIALRHTRSGWGDAVRVSVREVVRDALTFGARAVVMAHNHPSGDLRPSRDDVHVTRRLARTLDAIGVRLADHWIVTATGAISLRQDAML